MISWQGLIASSRHAAASPLPESIRRSVSTAYYAMFHALAASNAECLVGTPQGELGEPAWLRAYRGMDYGKARRYLEQGRDLFCNCSRLRGRNRFAEEIRAWLPLRKRPDSL